MLSNCFVTCMVIYNWYNFSAIEGTNVTYGIDMEMLNGGLLKRSVFDVSFENRAGDSSLLSVSCIAIFFTMVCNS